MFFQFMAGLVLFVFVLQMVLAIIAFPVAVVVAFVTRGQEGRHEFLSSAVTQLLVCLVTGGMLALMTKFFTERNAVSYGWLLITVGFLAAFITLADNAIDKQQRAADLNNMFSASTQGAASGSMWGFYAGLAVFIGTAIWPPLIGFIPGAAWMIGAVLVAAAWLAKFWLVRLIIGIGALGYLMKMGFMVLMAAGALVGAMKRSKEPPAQPV